MREQARLGGPSLTSLGSQSQTSKVGFRRASTVSGESRYWGGQEAGISWAPTPCADTGPDLKRGLHVSSTFSPPSRTLVSRLKGYIPQEVWQGQNPRTEAHQQMRGGGSRKGHLWCWQSLG